MKYWDETASRPEIKKRQRLPKPKKKNQTKKQIKRATPT